MDHASHSERLSRITTLWPVVQQAHQGAGSAASGAQRALIERYRGAVYRYLLGALRDQDAAEELFQEFALRFVRGDFRRADPSRGRFRDYVKSALINLVNDHFNKRKTAPTALPSDMPAPNQAEPYDCEAQFDRSWSLELMDLAWAELQVAHPPFYAALRFHVEHPDAHSPEIAKALSVTAGRTMTPTNARVTLHRAREKFAELLLAEVRRSLEAPNEVELLKELHELGLAKLCRPALDRHRAGD